MDPAPRLPLEAAELPQPIRKFGDPRAPGPAKTMAAKGLVPVKGEQLVALLLQLSADPDATVSRTATETLKGMPDNVLHAACESPLHAAFLDQLARTFGERDDVLERIAQNTQAADETVERMARRSSEFLSEIIATNQQRLLAAPKIIEALYHNRNTRMSTADRLVELCARNGVHLHGVPAFEQHVQAIQSQLIPEATEEPLPDDLDFQEALAADDDEDEAIERDAVEGTEEVKKKYVPLHQKLNGMGIPQRIRMAQIGDSAARSILIRDANRQVAYAAISSPRMGEAEAARVAHSKEVGEDILRFIGNKKDWIRNYEVKRALITNPKTPLGIALRFLSHMRDNDLKTLARSRNVPAPLKAAANQRIQQKQRGGRRK